MAFSPFEIFTGDAASEAAAQQRAFLEQQQRQVNQAIGGARTGGLAALQSGQYGALGALYPGIGTARNDIISSTGPALNSLYGGQAQGTGALTEGQTGGLAALLSGVASAQNAFAPLTGAAGQYGAARFDASNMSADALGLNGPEGVARAQAAFQAGPGFQFALNQGLESIARNANVGGMAAGGNALREAQTYGQGLAQQEYDKWRQSLAAREGLYAPLERAALGDVASGTSQAALTGGTGAANIYTGTGGRLADLFSTTGRTGADIYGTAGRSLADLASRGGLAAADIYGQTGAREADLLARLVGTQAGYAQGIAGPYTGTYQQEAAATAGGSKNLWNLIGGGAKLAAGGGWLPT